MLTFELRGGSGRSAIRFLGKGEPARDSRNLLPRSLNVVDLCCDAEVTLGTDLMSDPRDLGSECCELFSDARSARVSINSLPTRRLTRSTIELMVLTNRNTSPLASIVTCETEGRSRREERERRSAESKATARCRLTF